MRAGGNKTDGISWLHQQANRLEEKLRQGPAFNFFNMPLHVMGGLCEGAASRRKGQCDYHKAAL